MGRFNIQATITDKHGITLAKATNSYTKTHTLQAHFASKTTRPDSIFLHAEIAALLKLKKTDKPFKITIERYKKDGTPGLAKPCPICELAIKHWNIKRVEYTI